MLNAMRWGRIDDVTTRAFIELEREVEYDDGIQPTELRVTCLIPITSYLIPLYIFRFPTRDEVESANSSRLAQLEGEPKRYSAHDVPGRDRFGNPVPPDRVERALKDQIVPKVLPLKVGAQVMLVKVRMHRMFGHSTAHFCRSRHRRISFKVCL